MMKALTWKNIVILGVLLMAPLALTKCGEGNSVASVTAGPAGPTYPGGYYFDLTVTPHTIQANSTTTVTIRVWDSNGNAAAGVPVTLAGTDKADENNFGTTGSDGIAQWVFEVKANSGSVFPITVTVDSSSLTVTVQVVASVGTTA